MTPPAHVEPAGTGVGRRALHGSIAGAAAFVANLIAALLLVPVLIQAWGTERYGLWLALQSLLSLLITFDTGHHNYVGNELLSLHATDRAAARAKLASGLLGAALLGGIELIAAAALLWSGELSRALGQPERALPAGTTAAFALLVLGWVVQGSAGGVWVRLYPAAGQYARSVWWGVAYRLLSTLVIVVAVALGADIWGVVVASTVMTLVYAAVSFADVRRRFADLYPFWRGARLGQSLESLARSSVITACALCVQLQQHGVNVLLSGRLGLFVLPAFITTRTVANLFAQAAGIVTGPLMPEMVRLHALGEQRKLAELARAIWLVTGAPVNLGLCLGLPFYRSVYAAWTGGAMAFDDELFAWLALAISLRCFGAPFTSLLVGLNALGAQAWSALVQGLLVLGCLALTLPMLGLRAAGVAVALGELFGSVLVPIACVRGLAPELMRRLPARSLVLGVLPSLVVACCLLAAARGLAPTTVVMAVALPLAGLLYYLQWSELERPMQDRLLALARLARRASDAH
jgi:O-antigen/teichoic acid export membrane protein